jgi:PAS domain S-box-containing protein
MREHAIRLLELIEGEKLDEIIRSFTDATGVAAIIADPDGKPITRPHNFTALCSRYCRSTQKGRLRCQESDRYGGRESVRRRQRFIYRCLNAGLIDCAAPVIVEGRHLATILCGQVLTTPMDESQAAGRAREIGVTDTGGYLAALKEVPFMDPDRLRAVVKHMEVITQTISELVLQNQRLRKESEHYLDRLVNSVSDCIVSTDADAVITTINEAGLRMFGCREADIIGKSILSLIPDPLFEKNHHRYFAEARTGNARIETSVVGMTGASIPVQMSLSGISDTDRNNAGYVAVLRDITEEKNIERMKEDLMGMMTHDMENPVLSIRKALKLLVAGALGEMTPQQREIMRLAQATSDQLFGMVNDFLDIYRNENGHFLLHKQPIDVNHILETGIRRLNLFAREKRLTVRFDPKLPEDTRIYGDKNRLIRTGVNILENAVKYSPEGGEIRVSARRVTAAGDGLESLGGPYIAPVNGARWVLVTVSDQGPGIPSSYHRTIFDKFFTIQSKDETKRKGTGLGLTFCKLAVERHGGYIWLEPPAENENSTTSGCRFHFILPAEPADASEPAASKHAMTNGID